MSNYGRERYRALRISLNSKNQASETWLKFLRLFKINTVPVKLDRINGGLFRYMYCNANKSICIWTQHRPDQNTVSPGNAGVCVLRVEENSSVSFGKVRSALVRISNIPPKFTRTLKHKETPPKKQTTESEPLHITKQKHDTALNDLSDTRYKSVEEFVKQYKRKAESQMKSVPDIKALSGVLATAGVKHVLVVAARKAAIDVDPFVLQKLLKEYAKESGNALTTRINRDGSITLVTKEGVPREFSQPLKTSAELKSYLKALIRTAKQVIK